MFIFIGGAVAIALFLVMIVFICLYKKHKKIYAEMANERRKRALE